MNFPASADHGSTAYFEPPQGSGGGLEFKPGLFACLGFGQGSRSNAQRGLRGLSGETSEDLLFSGKILENDRKTCVSLDGLNTKKL